MFNPYKFSIQNIIGLNDALSEKTELSVIADEFDSTATYAVDDYVIHDGRLYKCNTPHTGAWDASHFTATIVSDEFGSGGGVADLSAIAPEFSDTIAYAIGDYVTHEGKLYRYTSAHAAGAWDSSEVSETTVAASKVNKSTNGVEQLSGQFAIGGRATYTSGGTLKNNLSIGNADVSGYGSLAVGKTSGTPTNVSSVSGDGSAAIGQMVNVTGDGSVGIGFGARANHNYSLSAGIYTKTGANNQIAFGTYNEAKSTSLLEIGKGTSNNARSNAFEVDTSGNVNAAGDITDGSGNKLSEKVDKNGYAISAPLVAAENAVCIFDDSENGGTAVGTGNFTAAVNSTATECNIAYPSETSETYELASPAVGVFAIATDVNGKIIGTAYATASETATIAISTAGTYIFRVYSVNSEASVISSEIIDGAGNALSEKFDATSYVNRYERYTVSLSNWSSTPDSNGYYTNTITTSAYNTYDGFEVSCTGSADGTPATSAQEAAFALVDDVTMPDGTGATSLTLYAKTKPTTTFYIRVKGTYKAKNAASSSKALDIVTGCNLTISNLGLGMATNATPFNGSTARSLVFVCQTVMFASNRWSNTVDANGYYTNSDTMGNINTYWKPSISLTNISNPVPTSSEIAAYNLVDYFAMDDGASVGTVTAYAKTKPTSGFTCVVKGVRFA